MRQGPEQSATKFKIGTKKRGNDGNMWVIVKTKKSKRWSKNKTLKTSKTLKIKKGKTKSKHISLKSTSVSGKDNLTFRPKIFDNDSISARKRWLPRDAFDIVVNWYKKHSQNQYKNYVHITGATFPNIKMSVSPEFIVKYPAWRELLMDPDEDGNYPIMYKNREYLVSGE